ncbi:MAG: hypothetical protein HQL54_13330 [Magnetococcales bacterium]|nr:hypothetical protein [Magnetococcales bacterium]
MESVFADYTRDDFELNLPGKAVNGLCLILALLRDSVDDASDRMIEAPESTQ